jgi:hypothetical protein
MHRGLDDGDVAARDGVPQDRFERNEARLVLGDATEVVLVQVEQTAHAASQ